MIRKAYNTEAASLFYMALEDLPCVLLPRQREILKFIDEQDRTWKKEIVDETDIGSYQLITKRVKELKDDGLVEITNDWVSGNKKYYSLTARGNEVVGLL